MLDGWIVYCKMCTVKCTLYIYDGSENDVANNYVGNNGNIGNNRNKCR